VVRVVDRGEPGKGTDEFYLKHTTDGDPSDPDTWYRSGAPKAKIEKGNIQAHNK